MLAPWTSGILFGSAFDIKTDSVIEASFKVLDAVPGIMEKLNNSIVQSGHQESQRIWGFTLVNLSSVFRGVEFLHVHLRAEQAGSFFRRLPGTPALGICLCRSRWYALPRAPRRPLQSYNTFALRLISEV
jgi:hypothetical protein